MKKYVLHVDYVKSEIDGDWHFIDAPTLARLHKVNLSDCDIVDVRFPETYVGKRFSKDQIHLRPRYNGKY